MDTVTLITPVVGSQQAIASGCWATFYDEKNFGGDSTTLVGPIELQALDKGSAKQLRRAIDSVVTGPRATLILYEKVAFSSRSVGFGPDTRQGNLIERLGFGGRIESMQLRCG